MEFDDRPDAAKRLEKARVSRNFETAKDAARYFGWVYETYIQHEQGTRGLSRQADKYAKAFRVSPGWLLTGEGQGPDRTIDPLWSMFERLKSPDIPEGIRAQVLSYAQGAIEAYERSKDTDTTPAS